MSLRGRHDAGAGEITAGLRSYYDATAARRDATAEPDWKLDERAAFLDRLRAAEARTLLEVGAGPGRDAAFFDREGLAVTAVDLSPAMVTLIRAKGVRAQIGDVRSLEFAAGSFDAVYSVNSLLHVSNAELPAALAVIHAILRPGGLFFLGVWGGGEREEGFADDGRFFSFRSDHDLLTYGKEKFDILDFHVVPAGADRFQSLTLVRP